jgi:KDO2-lipid IV(A) lauroyltransferase
MRYWLLRAATWLAARVPRGARIGVAGALTTLVFYLWRSKQRATVANMTQIIGADEHDPYAFRLARASWRDHGRYISDFLALSARPERVRDYVLAHWRDEQPAPGSLGLLDVARAEGKGVLIVTCHFGAWDIAGLITASRAPLHVVAERFDDPRIDAMVEAQRNAMGMQVLWLEKSPRQILRVLQQGGMVAILVDRPLQEGEGVPVEFFGRRCFVPGGVAQLALLSGAAIFPGFASYDEQFSTTYYTQVLPHFFASRTDDREADVIATTQRIYSALETVIRPRPAQWAMFRPFWPEKAPPTSDSPIASAATPQAMAGRSQA